MPSTGTHVREISENPSKNAVTSPTDPKTKAVDIDRKLKLYSVIEAFRQGKMPNNEQCERALDYALEHSPINESKLSKDGKNLVEDFRDIIRTAKQIVVEKNDDELLQNFIYHTTKVQTPSADQVKNVNTATSQQDMQADGEQAVEHLRTLGKLIFTNSEFRKLLKDVGILGRDVAADAATKAANAARPSEEQLRQVDETAPDNQWVGPNGEVRDHTSDVPDTGLAAKRDEAKRLKEQAQQKKEEVKQEGADRAQNVANAADNAQQSQAGPATSHVGTDGTSTSPSNLGGASNGQPPYYGGASQGSTGQNLSTSGMSDAQKEEAKDRANAGANAGSEQAKSEAKDVKNKVLGAIPDEHRERDYLDEKFPEERRDRFIYRLKKVIVENQRHKDYQQAIEFFLDKAEHYQVQAKEAGKQSGGTVASVRHDTNYQRAQHELRTLLERFANGASMQGIFDSVDQLYTDSKNDSELSHWFHELNTYIRQCLQEPGYIMKDECDRRGRELKDSSKKFWDPKEGKYAGHKDRFFDEVQNFFTSYADDGLNQRLGESVKTLFSDLLFNSEGNLEYKAHLWKDIRTVILPELFQQIGYIPIPRAEYTSPDVDLVVEQLTLESANLLPNIFEIEARNYFKLSPYDNLGDVSKHSFWVSFSQVQTDLKDVAFYIKKKTGFPKLTDSGYADVFLGGKGLSGKVHLESTGRRDHAFKVVEVKIKIDKLKFAVRDSKHSFLINTLRPLATGLIKSALTKAIEAAIRSGLEQVDMQVADIRERLDEAKQQEGTSKLDSLKASFQQKKAEGERKKAKAEEKAPSGRFSLTLEPDQKLVNWSSPDSMIEKIGSHQDNARNTGSREWESENFTLAGPANATRSAPTAGHSAPTTGHSAPTTTHSATTAVHPTSTVNQSGSTFAQSAPTAAQAAPTTAYTTPDAGPYNAAQAAPNAAYSAPTASNEAPRI
ncbi:uncharacterized protein JCM15063_004617 [Sporobolomyces koalae]|uniref:uncharacterized protein n=1 Tax=Sporobolomyces koalae TaxID=500713 RepID=UPI00317CF383